MQIYESIADRYGISVSLYVLAQIAYIKDDYQEAKLKAVEALRIDEEIGSRRNKVSTLGLLGKIAGEEGKNELGIRLLSLSFIISSNIGGRELEAMQSNLINLLSKSDYSEEQLQEVIEKAKTECDKDEGRSWIEELLRDL